ncbi:MAG TPA: 30S ribosomal protein S20 [Planctomycetaceae bacterium]|nr:30S ribosomal protein S20 [Planctomycetaceae bacterium]
MPNTPTAKKRLRQNVKARARNRAQRSALRSQIRKVRVAVEGGKLDDAVTEFRLATKKLDKAAAANLIHDNTASRMKSRLNAFIKKAQTAVAS